MGRRSSRALLCALAAASLAAAGCVDDPTIFRCNSDGGRPSCDPGEVCVEGSCAMHVDTTVCPSGLYYDDSAGSVKDTCVLASDASTGGNIDRGIPDLAPGDLRPALDLATRDLERAPDLSLCGNGVLDTGEDCDDGAGSPVPCPASAAFCDDNNPCTADSLTGTPCHLRCVNDSTPFADGDACTLGGTGGKCYRHDCCTGCWSGSACLGGTNGSACGSGGAACTSCDPGTNECQRGSCNAGLCKFTAVADGTTCPVAGGVCSGGACCTGCLTPSGSGFVCGDGKSTSACGSSGGSCATCTAMTCTNTGFGFRCSGCIPQCSGDGGAIACGNDGCGGTCGTCPANKVCMAGACVCGATSEGGDDVTCSDGIDNDCNGKTDCAEPTCNDERCAPSGQFCVATACTAGCRIAGSFVMSGSTKPGDPCQMCAPSVRDDDWSASPDGNACAGGGTCRQGACCPGCWTGSQCVTGNTVPQCGTAGNGCTSCDDANTCTSDGCTAGACTHTHVTDGTVCSATPTACVSTVLCGCSLGQACLTGPTCSAGVCDTSKTKVYGCCTGASCSGSACQ